jgi:hypothetical protein
MIHEETDVSGLNNSKRSSNLGTVRASFVSEMCGHNAATQIGTDLTNAAIETLQISTSWCRRRDKNSEITITITISL